MTEKKVKSGRNSSNNSVSSRSSIGANVNKGWKIAHQVAVVLDTFEASQVTQHALLHLKYLNEPVIHLENETNLKVASVTINDGTVLYREKMVSAILGPSTRICFVYRRYHVAITLDLTDSMYTVTKLETMDNDKKEEFSLPCFQSMIILETLLKALLNPLSLPVSGVLFYPTIKVSVVAKQSKRSRLLVKAALLETETLHLLTEKVRVGIDEMDRDRMNDHTDDPFSRVSDERDGPHQRSSSPPGGGSSSSGPGKTIGLSSTHLNSMKASNSGLGPASNDHLNVGGGLSLRGSVSSSSGGGGSSGGTADAAGGGGGGGGGGNGISNGISHHQLSKDKAVNMKGSGRENNLNMRNTTQGGKASKSQMLDETKDDDLIEFLSESVAALQYLDPSACPCSIVITDGVLPKPNTPSGSDDIPSLRTLSRLGIPLNFVLISGSEAIHGSFSLLPDVTNLLFASGVTGGTCFDVKFLRSVKAEMKNLHHGNRFRMKRAIKKQQRRRTKVRGLSEGSSSTTSSATATTGTPHGDGFEFGMDQFFEEQRFAPSLCSTRMNIALLCRFSQLDETSSLPKGGSSSSLNSSNNAATTASGTGLSSASSSTTTGGPLIVASNASNLGISGTTSSTTGGGRRRSVPSGGFGKDSTFQDAIGGGGGTSSSTTATSAPPQQTGKGIGSEPVDSSSIAGVSHFPNTSPSVLSESTNSMESMSVVAPPFFSPKIYKTALEPRVKKLQTVQPLMVIDHPYPWHGKPPAVPVFVHEVMEYRIHINPGDAVSCRLKEGFKMKQIVYDAHVVCYRLALSFSPHVTINYILKASRDQASSPIVPAVITIRVIASSNFLRSFIRAAKLPTAMHEETSDNTALKFHRYVNSILEGDRVLVHLGVCSPSTLLNAFAFESLTRWYRWFHVESYDLLFKSAKTLNSFVELVLGSWATHMTMLDENSNSMHMLKEIDMLSSSTESGDGGKSSGSMLHHHRAQNLLKLSASGGTRRRGIGNLKESENFVKVNCGKVVVARLCIKSDYMASVHFAFPVSTTVEKRHSILARFLVTIQEKLPGNLVRTFKQNKKPVTELCQVTVSSPKNRGLYLQSSRVLVSSLMFSKHIWNWPIPDVVTGHYLLKMLIQVRSMEGFLLTSSSLPINFVDSRMEVASRRNRGDATGFATFCKMIPTFDTKFMRLSKEMIMLQYRVSFVDPRNIRTEFWMENADTHFKTHGSEIRTSQEMNRLLIDHFEMVDSDILCATTTFLQVQACMTKDLITLFPWSSSSASGNTNPQAVGLNTVTSGSSDANGNENPSSSSGQTNSTHYVSATPSSANTSSNNNINNNSSNNSSSGPAASEVHELAVKWPMESLVQFATKSTERLTLFKTKRFDDDPNEQFLDLFHASLGRISDAQVKCEAEKDRHSSLTDRNIYAKVLDAHCLLLLAIPKTIRNHNYDEERMGEEEDETIWLPNILDLTYYKLDFESLTYPVHKVNPVLRQMLNYGTLSSRVSAMADPYLMERPDQLTKLKNEFHAHVCSAHLFDMVYMMYWVFASESSKGRLNEKLDAQDIEALLQRCPFTTARVDASLLRTILSATMANDSMTPTSATAELEQQQQQQQQQQANAAKNMTIDEVDTHFQSILNEFFQPIRSTSFYYFEPKHVSSLFQKGEDENDDEDDGEEGINESTAAQIGEWTDQQKSESPSGKTKMVTRTPPVFFRICLTSEMNRNVHSSSEEPGETETTIDINDGRICEVIMSTIHPGVSNKVFINLIFCTLPKRPMMPTTNVLDEGTLWFWTKAVRKRIRSRVKAMTSAAVLTALQRVYPVTEKTISLVQQLLDRGSLPGSAVTRMTIPLHFVNQEQGVHLFANHIGNTPVLNLRKVGQSDVYFVVEPIESSNSFQQQVPLGELVSDDLDDMELSIAVPTTNLREEWKKREYTVPYWAIITVAGPSVSLEFHHPSLSNPSKTRIIVDFLKNGILKTAERVNKMILLNSLHETRMASRLLIEPDEEPRSSLPAASSSMATSAAASPLQQRRSRFRLNAASQNRRRPPLAGGVKKKKEDELSAENSLPGNGNTWDPMSLANGRFACPCYDRQIFPIPERLHVSVAMHELGENALHSFVVTNRRSTYVYRDRDGQVFYLKLKEINGNQTSNNDGNASTGSGSGSTSRAAGVSSSLLESLTSKQPLHPGQDAVLLEVYGVDPPSQEMQDILYSLLSNKIANSTLSTFARLLHRNPQFKIQPYDLAFIKNNNMEKPDARYEFAVPVSITELSTFMFFLRQHLRRFMHQLCFATPQSQPQQHHQQQEKTGSIATSGESFHPAFYGRQFIQTASEVELDVGRRSPIFHGYLDLAEDREFNLDGTPTSSSSSTTTAAPAAAAAGASIGAMIAGRKLVELKRDDFAFVYNSLDNVSMGGISTNGIGNGIAVSFVNLFEKTRGVDDDDHVLSPVNSILAIDDHTFDQARIHSSSLSTPPDDTEMMYSSSDDEGSGNNDVGSSVEEGPAPLLPKPIVTTSGPRAGMHHRRRSTASSSSLFERLEQIKAFDLQTGGTEATTQEATHSYVVVVEIWQRGSINVEKLWEEHLASFDYTIQDYEFEYYHIERPIEIDMKEKKITEERKHEHSEDKQSDEEAEKNCFPKRSIFALHEFEGIASKQNLSPTFEVHRLNLGTGNTFPSRDILLSELSVLVEKLQPELCQFACREVFPDDEAQSRTTMCPYKLFSPGKLKTTMEEIAQTKGSVSSSSRSFSSSSASIANVSGTKDGLHLIATAHLNIALKFEESTGLEVVSEEDNGEDHASKTNNALYGPSLNECFKFTHKSRYWGHVPSTGAVTRVSISEDGFVPAEMMRFGHVTVQAAARSGNPVSTGMDPFNIAFDGSSATVTHLGRRSSPTTRPASPLYTGFKFFDERSGSPTSTHSGGFAARSSSSHASSSVTSSPLIHHFGTGGGGGGSGNSVGHAGSTSNAGQTSHNSAGTTSVEENTLTKRRNIFTAISVFENEVSILTYNWSKQRADRFIRGAKFLVSWFRLRAELLRCFLYQRMGLFSHSILEQQTTMFMRDLVGQYVAHSNSKLSLSGVSSSQGPSGGLLSSRRPSRVKEIVVSLPDLAFIMENEVPPQYFLREIIFPTSSEDSSRFHSHHHHHHHPKIEPLNNPMVNRRNNTLAIARAAMESRKRGGSTRSNYAQLLNAQVPSSSSSQASSVSSSTPILGGATSNVAASHNNVHSSSSLPMFQGAVHIASDKATVLSEGPTFHTGVVGSKLSFSRSSSLSSSFQVSDKLTQMSSSTTSGSSVAGDSHHHHHSHHQLVPFPMRFDFEGQLRGQLQDQLLRGGRRVSDDNLNKIGAHITKESVHWDKERKRDSMVGTIVNRWRNEFYSVGGVTPTNFPFTQFGEIHLPVEMDHCSCSKVQLAELVKCSRVLNVICVPVYLEEHNVIYSTWNKEGEKHIRKPSHDGFSKQAKKNLLKVYVKYLVHQVEMRQIVVNDDDSTNHETPSTANTSTSVTVHPSSRDDVVYVQRLLNGAFLMLEIRITGNVLKCTTRMIEPDRNDGQNISGSAGGNTSAEDLFMLNTTRSKGPTYLEQIGRIRASLNLELIGYDYHICIFKHVLQNFRTTPYGIACQVFHFSDCYEYQPADAQNVVMRQTFQFFMGRKLKTSESIDIFNYVVEKAHEYGMLGLQPPSFSSPGHKTGVHYLFLSCNTGTFADPFRTVKPGFSYSVVVRQKYESEELEDEQTAISLDVCLLACNDYTFRKMLEDDGEGSDSLFSSIFAQANQNEDDEVAASGENSNNRDSKVNNGKQKHKNPRRVKVFSSSFLDAFSKHNVESGDSEDDRDEFLQYSDLPSSSSMSAFSPPLSPKRENVEFQYGTNENDQERQNQQQQEIRNIDEVFDNVDIFLHKVFSHAVLRYQRKSFWKQVTQLQMKAIDIKELTKFSFRCPLSQFDPNIELLLVENYTVWGDLLEYLGKVYGKLAIKGFSSSSSSDHLIVVPPENMRCGFVIHVSLNKDQVPQFMACFPKPFAIEEMLDDYRIFLTTFVQTLYSWIWESLNMYV